jgi:hypothetical protein
LDKVLQPVPPFAAVTVYTVLVEAAVAVVAEAAVVGGAAGGFFNDIPEIPLKRIFSY